MKDPILESIRKYKDTKRFIFENDGSSKLGTSSKTVKDIQSSINNIVKGTSMVSLTGFEYNYSTNFVKISGTLDASIKWVYQRSDKIGFYITTEQLVNFNTDKANQLKVLTTFFTTEDFSNMINDGLANKSFS